MLPWPEIITTGISGCCSLTQSRSCRPSSRLPCSQMSRNSRFGRRRLDFVQRAVAVAGGAGGIALVLKQASDQLANVGFIVNNENIGRHIPWCSRCFLSVLSGDVGLFGRLARLNRPSLPSLRSVRRGSAAASRRRVRRGTSPQRRAIRCRRHAPRECGRRWPDQGPVPFSRVVT